MSSSPESLQTICQGAVAICLSSTLTVNVRPCSFHNNEEGDAHKARLAEEVQDEFLNKERSCGVRRQLLASFCKHGVGGCWGA